jgi:hypothetical protein
MGFVSMETPPRKGAAFCCGGAQLEQKRCVVDLNRKAAEELAEIAA